MMKIKVREEYEPKQLITKREYTSPTLEVLQEPLYESQETMRNAGICMCPCWCKCGCGTFKLYQENKEKEKSK